MIIKGNTVGTPMPRTNYEQTDPTKADYLKGKDVLDQKIEDAKKAAGDAQKTADAAQKKHTSRVVTLTVSGWVDNTQTVEVDGVTTNNTLIVASAPENYDAYSKAGVYCSAQAVNSMTFICKSVPATDLNANVMILT